MKIISKNTPEIDSYECKETALLCLSLLKPSDFKIITQRYYDGIVPQTWKGKRILEKAKNRMRYLVRYLYHEVH